MSQRHEHADAIIAWAEGAKIEYRDPTRHRSGLWVECQHPEWYENFEYRIKPPAKKYRVALFLKSDEDSVAVVANSQANADWLETRSNFVRWLTDWVDYEEKCGG